MVATADVSARKAIRTFLLDAFTSSELRFLLSDMGFDTATINWNAAPIVIAHDVVEALNRHGLLRLELIDALSRERPARAKEIEQLSRLLGLSTPPLRPIQTSETAARLTPGRSIFEVFRTAGPPDATFVAPSQLPEIAARLTFLGEGLVIEGASGVGKTTVIRHAFAQLAPPTATTWVRAKEPSEVAMLRETLNAGTAALNGYLVVDDFHQLPHPLRKALADAIKVIADAGRNDCKIVLIGINPVGDSLVADSNDVSGRFTVISMNRQPKDKIVDLIEQGERAANITFERREEIAHAARGSFYTAQLLCQELCLLEGIATTPSEHRRIVEGPFGRVADRIRDKLKFKYQSRLVTFASYGKTRPAQGATLALLWMLHGQFDDGAPLAIVRSRYPRLADEVDWLLSSHLRRLLEEEPRLKELFFYNRDAGVLSAEDPQLDFYLQGIRWPALARDAGLIHLRWEEGHPNFGGEPPPSEPSPSPITAASQQHSNPSQPHARVLHLSDLHISSRTQALLLAQQLREDLVNDLAFDKLAAVIVSGDISNRGTHAEYGAAQTFFRQLRTDFGLSAEHFVLVPGNHDLDWSVSRSAYGIQRKDDWEGPSDDTSHWEAGDYVEVAPRMALSERFRAFADFHFEIRSEHYSLDGDNQATVHHFPAARLLFLGLNSAWAIDHHHTDRADINGVALGRALSRLDREPDYEGSLRIAVWHHPIAGKGDDRITDTGFLERLAQAGFRFALHGHIHKAQAGLFRLDMSPAGRRLDILGAGTFGAVSRQWQPGHPLQYQILEFKGEQLTVHTRRREEPMGAWKPDARWTSGKGKDPLPRYVIEI